MYLKCLRNISLTSLLSSVLFVLLSSSLHARVFDITKQTIGTYLRGSYAVSSLADRAYANSSGANTSFSDEVGTNTSGEFGLYMGAGRMGLRLSVERFSTASMEAISGVNSGGTELMSLDSDVSALIYKASFEYAWFLTTASKVYLSLGVGSAAVELVNVYDLSAAGLAAYPGTADFTERASQSLIMGEVLFGYEYNFSADTTILLDLGWRQMQAKGLSHKSAFTNFDGSSVAVGDSVLGEGTANRSLDLGGFSIGLGFRFYINN